MRKLEARHYRRIEAETVAFFRRLRAGLPPAFDPHARRCDECAGHGRVEAWPVESSRPKLEGCKACEGLGFVVPDEEVAK